MIENLTNFANQFMSIYFWVYLFLITLTILNSLTDEYKRIREIKIQKGTYKTESSFTSIIAFVLWIMSFKY